MAEAPTAEMIIRHLDNVTRLHRLPFGRTFCRPAAGSPRGIPRETPIIFYGLEFVR
jgi:hypothetical protein